MSAPHLLRLSDLHAAAPGVLSVIFGPEADYDGAPHFIGPVRSREGWQMVTRIGRTYVSCRAVSMDWRHDFDADELTLDLRNPGTVTRLGRLCCGVLKEPETWAGATGLTMHILHGLNTEQHIIAFRALVLKLAPRIAAREVKR